MKEKELVEEDINLQQEKKYYNNYRKINNNNKENKNNEIINIMFKKYKEQKQKYEERFKIDLYNDKIDIFDQYKMMKTY